MSYQVHIGDFEGPLDLLLQLIQKAQVRIEDIFVSEITAQYLQVVGELREEQMDNASDFLLVAAQLLYIKSRRLLPAPPAVQEEEEEDPEQAFIRRLQEYQVFKAAGENLRPLFEQGQKAFARLPEDLPAPPVEANLPDVSADTLLLAFLSALSREPEEKEELLHRVKQDVYTVRERSGMIRNRLREKSSLSFYDLFAQSPTHMELVVTFMAVLELMNRGEVRVFQKDTFAPIRLRAANLREEDEGTYMDEEEQL